MPILIIKSKLAPDAIITYADEPVHQVVEAWQKSTLYYLYHNQLPGCLYKVAESEDIVDAMLESCGLFST